MAEGSTQRYILMPAFDFAAPMRESARHEARTFLADLPTVRSMTMAKPASLEPIGGGKVEVIDTAFEAGPRLVEADAETAASINLGGAPLQMVPEVEYPPPNQPLQILGGGGGAGGSGGAGAGGGITIECKDAVSGAGVAGAHVVAFTDFANGIGAEAIADASGRVTVDLTGSVIEQLYVYPPLAGYWGGFRRALPITNPIVVPLTPIDLSYVDCVRHYYGASKFSADAGVVVGVLDTGAGPHRDLNLVGGVNTVTGESRTDFSDARGHGTHVAGLIGSNGTSPNGLRGLAPGVELRVYRVFPPGDGGATNYAILKAMIFAAQDGCDIVNLSLGSRPQEPIVEEAVRDARNGGMLVVAAAGNDSRKSVEYPGAYPGATAISALGREGTFPAESLDESAVVRPPSGTDPEEFIAGFSNVGPQVAAMGPGVGALSTVPNDGFGAMSGTSMAAPVVAGAIACLLSRDAATLGMPREAARSDRIEALLKAHGSLQGFGGAFEGSGLPDPATV